MPRTVAAEKAAAKASGNWLGVLRRHADGAKVQALLQIERDFFTAAQTRDMAFLESLTIRDMRAHVFGDAAIASMEAESKGTYKGKSISENPRGIDFFVKRDGRCQSTAR